MCASTKAISTMPLRAIAYFLPTAVEYSDLLGWTAALMTRRRS